MQGAAYNSRIDSRGKSRNKSRTSGMLTSIPSRFVISLLFGLAWLFVVPSEAQNWTGVEEQLGKTIVSVTGQKTMALEVLNRSSLSPAATDDIRRNLLTQLAVLGIRFAAAEQAAARVRVWLSEDLQNYVWIAEIHLDAKAASVVMVSLPRSAPTSVEPEPAAMVLHRIPLWSQPERILDVVLVDGNPARILVLDPNTVTSYRLQGEHWQPEQSLPITHSRPWPRDLRGRLVLRKDGEKNKDHQDIDHQDNDPLFFDAYLPGMHCRNSAGAPPIMTCYDSDDPWPLGTDLINLNAAFTASRNFFSGALSPGVGKQALAPAFYSSAPVLQGPTLSLLIAAVDGQVHRLDGVTDQVVEKPGWGSDIASLRSRCGSGWQVLATAPGAGSTDSVRAFELVGREPVPASAALDVNGAITALWTESSGAGVVAVAHNSETGRYEAFRLILTCDR